MDALARELRGSLLAAATTAAVERDTALVAEELCGALHEIGREHVDVHALGEMTFGVFRRRAHVEQNEVGLLLEEVGKVAGIERGDVLRSGAGEEREEAHK